MYIRRKLYSNIEGERVPVEQTVLFSAKDDAKGAAIGAGVAAGTAGIGAAGLYGAKKAADKAVNKAIENRMAIETGKIAGDAEKAEARHEAAQAASNRVNKIVNSAKGWLTNAEGKEAAKAYEKTIAGKSGAAKEEMIKKLARLNKAAGNTALKRQLGVGAAILGTGAAVGAGVAHLKGKKKKAEEKVYSILMTEDELKLFSEMSTKEFEEKEKEVKGHLKRTLGHGIGAAANGTAAVGLAKNAIKTKNKLSGAAALLAAGNTAYHSSKAIKEGKSWRKKGQEPRYQRKLIKELDKEWGIEDKKNADKN